MKDLLFVLLWLITQCIQTDEKCFYLISDHRSYRSGYVTPYSYGVMESVMQRRMRYFNQLQSQRFGYLPDCLAATNENNLDNYILVLWSKPSESKVSELKLCYVVDVAQRKHIRERVRNNLILEVDYETYSKYGRGPVKYKVLRWKSE